MKKKVYFTIALAFLLRILLLIYAYPTWHHGFLDTDLAQNIVEGHGISVREINFEKQISYLPTAQEMPGHAILLAFFQWLTGSNNLIYIQILQILIDSLLCGVIYLLGKKHFSEKIGLIGAALFAFYLPEASLSVSPMRDVWVSFGVLSVTFLLLRHIETKRDLWLLLMALLVGVSSYFRPTVLFLPLFFGAALWVRSMKDWKKILLKTILVQSIAFCCLLPWGLRNYQHFGKLILTRTVFYQSLWEGFGEFRNPHGAVLNDELLKKQMRAEGFIGNFASPEYDNFIKPKVLKALREDPVWYATTVLKRIPYALLINRVPWGILQNEQVTYHKAYLENDKQKGLWDYFKKILTVNPGFLITKFWDALILGSALAGIYLSRRRWRDLLPLFIVPVYFVAVHIPIHIEGRYMVPSHWVFLIFSAVTLRSLFEKLRGKSHESKILAG